MLEKIANPVGFSKSLGVPQSSSGRVRRGSWPPPGRPARISGDKIPSHDNTVPDLAQGPLEPLAIERPDAPVIPVAPPVHEWLADLQIQGRSNQTIDWYRRRMNGYLGGGGARTLDRLTGSELKRCATWYETTGGSGWSTAGVTSTPPPPPARSPSRQMKRHRSSFDVSGIVSRWVSGQAPNLGFIFKTDDESLLDGGRTRFASDDYSPAATQRPRLNVTYTDGSHAIAHLQSRCRQHVEPWWGAGMCCSPRPPLTTAM